MCSVKREVKVGGWRGGDRAEGSVGECGLGEGVASEGEWRGRSAGVEGARVG